MRPTKYDGFLKNSGSGHSSKLKVAVTRPASASPAISPEAIRMPTFSTRALWAALNRELSLQRPLWNSHRLLDPRGPQEKDWFFDDQLLDRADRNLEHLFTLLALLLPVEAVRIAFRALHTDDLQLKATAFEYLESATPADTRQLLLPLLETDAQTRLRAPGRNAALQNLLASTALVNQHLNLNPVAKEAAR